MLSSLGKDAVVKIFRDIQSLALAFCLTISFICKGTGNPGEVIANHHVMAKHLHSVEVKNPFAIAPVSPDPAMVRWLVEKAPAKDKKERKKIVKAGLRQLGVPDKTPTGQLKKPSNPSGMLSPQK